MTSNAHAVFDHIRDNVTQLIGLHACVQQGRGRRHRQEAIHRAGVVMMVGAWEAYVERVLLDSFDVLDAQIYSNLAPSPGRTSFKLHYTRAKSSAGSLHTPNAENVQRLFMETLGFDPWPSWSWVATRRNWDGAEMRRRMNQWLRVRHSVAHGALLPADIPWIRNPNEQPRLTLLLLRECVRFFRRVVSQTDAALAQFIASEHGIPRPW